MCKYDQTLYCFICTLHPLFVFFKHEYSLEFGGTKVNTIHIDL